MSSWIIYAFIVMVGAVGIHLFSKLSMAYVDPLFLIVIMSAMFFLAALVVYAVSENKLDVSSIPLKGWGFSVLAGLCIAGANIAVIYMYKHQAPISLALPLTRVGGAMLAVLAGVLIFAEGLTVVKSAGIGLALVSIILMTL
jgi:uncharacterized membrane protein